MLFVKNNVQYQSPQNMFESKGDNLNEDMNSANKRHWKSCLWTPWCPLTLKIPKKRANGNFKNNDQFWQCLCILVNEFTVVRQFSGWTGGQMHKLSPVPLKSWGNQPFIILHHSEKNYKHDVKLRQMKQWIMQRVRFRNLFWAKFVLAKSQVLNGVTWKFSKTRHFYRHVNIKFWKFHEEAPKVFKFWKRHRPNLSLTPPF